MSETQRTSVPNETFNLISIIYHALEGAQTYDKYIQDAGQDEQLVSFLQKVKQQDDDRAREALQLLDRYISH